MSKYPHVVFPDLQKGISIENVLTLDEKQPFNIHNGILDFSFAQKKPEASEANRYIAIFPSQLITSASGLSQLPSEVKQLAQTINLSNTRITEFPTLSLQGFNNTKKVILPSTVPQKTVEKLSSAYPHIQFTQSKPK